MSELSPEARALFHAARRAGDPPADAQARIREALRAQVPPPAAKASAPSVTARLLSAVVLAVAATWGVARARAPRPSPRTPASAAQPAPRVVPPAPSLEPPPAPAPPVSATPPGVALPPARPRVHPPRPRAALASTAVVVPPARPVEAPPAAPSSLGVAEEVRLVSAARGALRAHDGARALSALDEHQRRFPRGVLAQESSAVRVLALCEVGRVEEARALARRWLASAGSSPLAANLQRSCAGDAR